MAATGPTPIVKRVSIFQTFLTQLRENDVNSELTKEEIAEEIIKWLGPVTK